jgi:hypothetical protein
MKKLKTIGISIGLVLSTWILVPFILNITAQSEYVPVTPIAQSKYDTHHLHDCRFERSLAKAKIQDDEAGVLFDLIGEEEYNNINWNDMHGKASTSCPTDEKDTPVIQEVEGAPTERSLQYASLHGAEIKEAGNPLPPLPKHEILRNECRLKAQDGDSCYRIMEGVFIADSGFCTEGIGARTNNCGNIRPGSGKYGDSDVKWTVDTNFRSYATIEDGIKDNVSLYVQLYEGMSIWNMSRVWAGGSDDWYRTVNQYANS